MAATNGAGGEHRVVLVTGASSGIGQAIAEHLARQGWRVFGGSRSGAALAERGVEMIALDVDDDGSVERGIAMVLRATLSSTTRAGRSWARSRTPPSTRPRRSSRPISSECSASAAPPCR
jgi:NAD(P)-dependent dehydrogenase (short-subunit alcohol dehydrogenase family)